MIVVVYFLYPETKGYTLEQVAVLFDGEAALRTMEEVDRALHKTDTSQEKDQPSTVASKRQEGSSVQVTHVV